MHRLSLSLSAPCIDALSLHCRQTDRIAGIALERTCIYAPYIMVNARAHAFCHCLDAAVSSARSSPFDGRTQTATALATASQTACAPKPIYFPLTTTKTLTLLFGSRASPLCSILRSILCFRLQARAQLGHVFVLYAGACKTAQTFALRYMSKAMRTPRGFRFDIPVVPATAKTILVNSCALLTTQRAFALWWPQVEQRLIRVAFMCTNGDRYLPLPVGVYVHVCSILR